jgi:hypothetical protein
MWGRFWERLREWYYGRWELYDYPGVIGGAHQPHWTARIAQALVRFWLANWKWIIGSPIALVGLALGIIKFNEKHLSPTDITNILAGGDNFCFLEPQIANSKNLNDPVVIRAINNGSAPIPNLQFFISPYWVHGDAKNHPNEYYSILPSSISINCNVGASFINVFKFDGSVGLLSLKPGRYRVEFTTTVGTGWYEILTIEQSYDDLVGVVDVFIPGKEPYHSPRPRGYVEW